MVSSNMVRFIVTLLIFYVSKYAQTLLTEPKVQIIFGGDVSFAGLNYFLKKNQYCSYNKSFSKIKDRFKADYKIVNLESPLGRLENTPENPDKEKVAYLIAELESVQALKYLGVDAVSVANNHFADFGEPSMKLTLAELWKNEIKASGFSFGKKSYSDQEPIIFSKNGILIGLLSYCVVNEGCYNIRHKLFLGPALYEKESALNDIKELKKIVDIIIVFLHWGDEFAVIGKVEQVDLAKELSPYVNVIVGSHSHTPGEHYYMNKTLVIQSLGNFLYPMKNTKHSDFQPNKVGGSKKKLKSVEKMTKKFRNPSSVSEIVMLSFDRNGLIKEDAQFAHFNIDMDDNKCLVVKENEQNSPWKKICGEEDKKCAGNSNCNAESCAKNGKTIGSYKSTKNI